MRFLGGRGRKDGKRGIGACEQVEALDNERTRCTAKEEEGLRVGAAEVGERAARLNAALFMEERAEGEREARFMAVLKEEREEAVETVERRRERAES